MRGFWIKREADVHPWILLQALGEDPDGTFVTLPVHNMLREGI
jgi:hypothetical protein